MRPKYEKHLKKLGTRAGRFRVLFRPLFLAGIHAPKTLELFR